MQFNLQSLAARSGLIRVATIVIGFIVSVHAAPVAAYTSESPEVKAMVEQGLKFLETEQLKSESADSGVLWLVGLTLVKCDKDDTHPIVAAGIRRCQALHSSGSAEGDSRGIYAKAVAVIFLCETDPIKYKAEAQYFLDQLLKLQGGAGGWGYPQTGIMDTSQTQYGVLALWTANHVGLDVPTDRIERACHYLLRTQDVEGAWPYNAVDPGGSTRVNQLKLANNLALPVAGLGAVYMCADMLGIDRKEDAVNDNDGLPPAMKKAKNESEKKEGKPKRASKLDVGFLRRGQADGNAWMARNYKIDSSSWGFYYRYALERYSSFREAAEGNAEQEPAWYNEGVELLKSRQNSKGGWTGDHDDHVSTCFAILFLIRSTKKSIGKTVNTEGALAGGRGLPSDVTSVRMKGNQIVGAQAAKSIDDLLDLLETPDDTALESILEGTTPISLGGDATTRAKQAERLRKIVSIPNFQARMVAVKALAQARDLENVPVLIYALGDPDWRVAKEARDGLRLISRRFDGFDMPDKSTSAQRTAAQLSWKKWFLSIRPEAEFLD